MCTGGDEQGEKILNSCKRGFNVLGAVAVLWERRYKLQGLSVTMHFERMKVDRASAT